MTTSSGPLDPTVAAGVHAIVFAQDVEAARAFFRDVLDLASVDAGGGRLMFALPPAELDIHSADADERPSGPRHELYLMCHDIETARRELTRRGVEFVAPVTDQGWGLVTRLRVPGAGELGLYQPRHASPLPPFSRPDES